MKILEQFINERKWYNAYLYLQDLEDIEYTEQLVEFFLDKMLPIASQVYPLTLTQVIIRITKNYSRRLDALLELEKKIESSLFKEKAHKDSMILLKIAITDIFFDMGKTIETSIYEFKGIELNDEQQFSFDRLAIKYFEKIKNYDEAYLCAKRLNDDEKITQNGILARKVFFLPRLKDEPDHYSAVREGDFAFILKHKPLNHEFILEKTYIIKILELCRNKKEIKINDLANILKLDKKMVNLLLVKAIGLSLIDGKINGEKDILELSNSALQTITKTDLLEIKDQFKAWRNRVDEVIRVME